MTIEPNFRITDHFKYTEPGLACSCCQRIRLVTEFWECVALLEEMRIDLGFPIDIVSGYRCKDHNKEVGGAADSMHMLFAADSRPLSMPDESDAIWNAKMHSMWHWAERRMPDTGGIGIYNSWVHIDTRQNRSRWDERTAS